MRGEVAEAEREGLARENIWMNEVKDIVYSGNVTNSCSHSARQQT
jgi:hypothetical protein